jgi:hypothetical protein
VLLQMINRQMCEDYSRDGVIVKIAKNAKFT